MEVTRRHATSSFVDDVVELERAVCEHLPTTLGSGPPSCWWWRTLQPKLELAVGIGPLPAGLLRKSRTELDTSTKCTR